MIDLFLRSTKFVSGSAFSEYVVKWTNMNCKGDSESPWKIPLWIFVSNSSEKPSADADVKNSKRVYNSIIIYNNHHKPLSTRN